MISAAFTVHKSHTEADLPVLSKEEKDAYSTIVDKFSYTPEKALAKTVPSATTAPPQISTTDKQISQLAEQLQSLVLVTQQQQQAWRPRYQGAPMPYVPVASAPVVSGPT